MLTTFGQNASLLTVFNDCKVKYMVVGGLAVNYYCSNREVGDLDLLVSPTTKNAINIAQAFAKLDSQGLKEIDLCKFDYRKLSEFGVQVSLKKFLNADILTPLPEFDFCTSYRAYPVVTHTHYMWFFDVSNGIEEVSERGGDQVDHGDVGGGVSVSACLCPSGLEETVEALHAGVAVA